MNIVQSMIKIQSKPVKLVMKIISIIVGILFIIIFYNIQEVLAILLAIPYFFILYIKRNDLESVLLIVGAILGSIGEIICVHMGVWRYTVATTLGIPMWLPFAWGLAVYVMYGISSIIYNFIKQ